MERFQFLVKQKIVKQLSGEEAMELQRWLEENESCRLIFETIFSRLDGDEPTTHAAEKAFALHAERLRGSS